MTDLLNVPCEVLRIAPDGTREWVPVTMTEEDLRTLTAAAQRAVTVAQDGDGGVS